MLMATLPNCLLSIRLLVSSANEEIVVNEPQNHTAASKEYFESKFHKTERIENTPEVKLPITLITRMLIGSVPRIKGDSAILYLRKAPATAPTESNANSIHLIFSCAHHLFSSLVGIISAFFEKGGSGFYTKAIHGVLCLDSVSSRRAQGSISLTDRFLN
jgi:hypothetical protein